MKSNAAVSTEVLIRMPFATFSLSFHVKKKNRSALGKIHLLKKIGKNFNRMLLK
jgi:hypothetical protein